MKNLEKLTLTSIALAGLIIGMMPFASAEEISVSIPAGTSTPGCEVTKECFIPDKVTVIPTDVVVWTNNDSAAHTVTSGSPADGLSGEFDSGLFMAGATFSHTFDTLGEYDYFCIVHPWMTGQVFVTVGGDVKKDLGTISIGGNMEVKMDPITVGSKSEDETTVSGLSSDGKVRVEITASNPVSNEMMSIDIKFRDSNGGTLKKHANYDIIVMQNGNQILSQTGAHSHEGTNTHMTSQLDSDDPIDIKVTLLGFGLPDDKSNWTGPKGEVLMFNVVPEFGAVATMILAVAIISIVAVTAKSRIIPRF